MMPTVYPSPAPPKVAQEKPPYVAPAIAWEQEFVALAQASVISDPNCIPGRDPRCSP